MNEQDLKLIYVNKLGKNYKKENIYEFLFTKSVDPRKEIWNHVSRSWMDVPAEFNPDIPDNEIIDDVGVFKYKNIELSVLQENEIFGMVDGVDEIISIAWEYIPLDEELDLDKKRLSFRFGMLKKEVDEELYARDLKLNYNNSKIEI